MKKSLLKKIVLSGFIFAAAISSVDAQAPTWQLKCEYYDSLGGYGSINNMYDFDPDNEQKGAIVNSGNNMRLTTDGGQTWLPRVNHYHLEIIKYVAPNTLLYAGDERIYRSVDGGQNFTMVADTIPSNTPKSIDYSGNFVLIGGDLGSISYSNDGGLSWKNKTLNSNNGGKPGISYVQVVSPTFAYAFSVNSNIVFYTTDAGNTWTSIDQLSGITVEGSPVTFPNILFERTAFTAKDENNWLLSFYYNPSDYWKRRQYLYSTTNAGASWTNITDKLPLSSGNPMEIGSLFSTPDGKVFASCNSTNADKYLYSGDFGTSNFLIDSVGTNITIPNDNFKKINNKVYLLARSSVGGYGTRAIYTTNFSGSTGVSEATDNFNSFTIYPNPAYNSVTLTNLSNNATVNITDLSGKQVYSTTANTKELNINTTGFANGIYLVQITNNGAVGTKKLVISK